LRKKTEKELRPLFRHALIAVLENFQQADGSVVIPEGLRPWVGKEKIEIKGTVAYNG
jgi:hypothetical protein